MWGLSLGAWPLALGYQGRWLMVQSITWSTTSLVAQVIKYPPAMLETQVRSLGQEDPLEKGIATHSSTLAWRAPWTEEPGGL